MFGLFQRPKLDASFAASEALSNEFTREIDLAGRLALKNDGSDADLTGVEMMIVAGFRRIPLTVPDHWVTFRLAKGQSRADDLRWKLTLDSPLRAQAGELFVSAHDQKRKTWQWRLPFTFELR
ncbi:MAG: hypothetical protein IT293_02980 [Deltaproteobacteria bacterium]|nr:hypothetical protein [Deltaproteobacteria bacterium]